jgi:hypothetical protein
VAVYLTKRPLASRHLVSSLIICQVFTLGDTMSSSWTTRWVDAGGRQTITRLRTDAGLTLPLEAAYYALSNAAPFMAWGGPEVVFPPAPVAALYSSAAQTLLLSFGCGDASIATLRVPAPVSSIFLPDLATVDLLDPLIAAITVAGIGVVVSETGSLAVSLIGGKLLPWRGTA